jgi:hypothetical protein
MNEETQQNPQQTPTNGRIPRAPHITETPQKAIRTYEGDVADILAHKNISTAAIARAEKKRETGADSIGSIPPVAPADIFKKIGVIAISLIIICIGIGGAYYLYTLSPLAQHSIPSPVAPTISSIVPADDHVSIPTDGKTALNILSAIKNEISKPQPPNSIKEIALTQTIDGQRYKVKTSDMIADLGINVPQNLTLSLSDDWMLGVYADANGNKSVFVDATVDYFQNAFAAMLQWENLMPDDLKQYFYSIAPTDIASTSTIPASPGVVQGSFTDHIVQNKDVREFTTTDGKMLFLYSFIDNQHLVITGSESTLSEILTRLEQKAFMR